MVRLWSERAAHHVPLHDGASCRCHPACSLPWSWMGSCTPSPISSCKSLRSAFLRSPSCPPRAPRATIGPRSFCDWRGRCLVSGYNGCAAPGESTPCMLTSELLARSEPQRAALCTGNALVAACVSTATGPCARTFAICCLACRLAMLTPTDLPCSHC